MRNRFGPAGRAIQDVAIKLVEQGKPAEQQGEE
jgi:hypothetical protein